MRDFVGLLNSLEKALHNEDRQAALLRYWQHCDPQDRIWSLWLLLDRRPPKRRHESGAYGLGEGLDGLSRLVDFRGAR